MKYEGQITENFSWEEFQRSSKSEDLGIDNSIPGRRDAWCCMMRNMREKG